MRGVPAADDELEELVDDELVCDVVPLGCISIHKRSKNDLCSCEG